LKKPKPLPLERHFAIAEQLRTMTRALQELVEELYQFRDLDRSHCPGKTAGEILDRLWELRLRLQGQMQREYPAQYGQSRIYYPLLAEFSTQRELPFGSAKKAMATDKGERKRSA
jgi:hypothetical protein